METFILMKKNEKKRKTERKWKAIINLLLKVF